MSRLVRLCVERTGDVLWIDPSTVARVSGAEPHGTIQCTRIVLRDGCNLVVAGLPDALAMLLNEQKAEPGPERSSREDNGMPQVGCPECAKLTGGCLKHGTTYHATGAPITVAPPQGWQCPRCKAIHAPWVPECAACNAPGQPEQ